jgi:anti-sigma factor RsiW
MAEAVRIHVQAGLADRRIEVASSDRHTVKPWLSARLDFSPPVNDLKDEGFELAGGRIEVLRGRRVAILVYRHRLHFIDVFVQPLPSGAPAHSGSLRGFHLAHAMGDGMDFLAVSDVDAAVLQDFVARLAARPAPR